MATAESTYQLFCMGNPLLDMQIANGEALLQKYNLKANDAILAAPEHMNIYEDIKNSQDVKYVAGGAAQNAARGAAYILPEKSVVYTGCVGDDDLADRLREANTREGVESAYLVKAGQQTGACGVVITGHHRSLVTTLRAAEAFDKAHLSTPEVASLIQGAKYFYIGGFFLTHGVESAIELAKTASDAGKVVALNLSAPFIAQFFKVQLDSVLPYVDYLIGNESEAEAYGAAAGIPDPKDHVAVARTIALLKKTNPSRPRVVVITRGADSTVVVSSKNPDDAATYPVEKLRDDEIVDTNGAGDAFAGGFMGGLVLGKSLEECVRIGQKMGAMNLREVGPQYTWPKVQIL
ncbi:putative adenosine kinase [Serendipita vermifera]|nr:putative adenosine kinase [Serendipita vermifera]